MSSQKIELLKLFSKHLNPNYDNDDEFLSQNVWSKSYF